ncbi:MAG: hypothetical protein WC231_00635 [Dehalococcoidales bacterium]|nr:hypothetical protein [Dehalococcoidales bacterium]MDD5605376.1 hypothetical protein [Dehalococcoidales bacterium]NLE90866.1 hypothetical protein [Dehalococcoidales bacterium]
MKRILASNIISTKVFALIVVATILFCGCNGEAGLTRQINQIADPYHFSIFDWQIHALTRQYDQYIFNSRAEDPENSELVKEYFSNRQQVVALEQKLLMLQQGLEDGDVSSVEEQILNLSERNQHILSEVEGTLSAQVETILAECGIINPWQDVHNAAVVFPPVNFVIQPPPHLLVISPRDEISRYKDIALVQIMNDDQKQAVEEEIEKIGMSGLVVRLGGIATYPSFVADTLPLDYSIEVAVEEWFHQYLFFRPLGFRYGMHIAGIIRDYEIATVNEALAGMVSQEIASMVYEKYYQETATTSANYAMAPANEFDFYAEMRTTRLVVDEMLEKGQVEEAEQYMEERRLYLASNGYYIRKLNQAYFAFYGTYASSPGSVSPIGSGLKALREQNPSLKDFVEQVSSMTDAEDIIAAAD